MKKNSLPHATAKDICLWLLRRYQRLRIQGDSMLPTLKSQQEILINPRAYKNTHPIPGDVVIADHPQQPGLDIVKRILFVESDGRCYLQGDNKLVSNDSRQFGLVPLNKIKGKICCLFP